jgi:hypothetical protein
MGPYDQKPGERTIGMTNAENVPLSHCPPAPSPAPCNNMQCFFAADLAPVRVRRGCCSPFHLRRMLQEVTRSYVLKGISPTAFATGSSWPPIFLSSILLSAHPRATRRNEVKRLHVPLRALGAFAVPNPQSEIERLRSRRVGSSCRIPRPPSPASCPWCTSWSIPHSALRTRRAAVGEGGLHP